MDWLEGTSVHSMVPFVCTCFRDNPDVVNSVEKLKQFQVPQFMIDKMKTFMKSVQGPLYSGHA